MFDTGRIWLPVFLDFKVAAKVSNGGAAAGLALAGGLAVNSFSRNTTGASTITSVSTRTIQVSTESKPVLEQFDLNFWRTIRGGRQNYC